MGRWLVLAVIVFCLGACSPQEVEPEAVEEALRGVFSGEESAYNEMACEGGETDPGGLNYVSLGATIDDVTCTTEGERLACTIVFRVGEENPVSVPLLFDIEGDKICPVVGE